MKKTLLFFCLLPIILALCVGCHEQEDDIAYTQGLEYRLLSDGTYAVGQGEATQVATVIIPPTYNGVAVTCVGPSLEMVQEGLSHTDFGFSSAYLREIILPDSITTIGYRAFRHCTGLFSVQVGKGLESIGNQAFYGCERLTALSLPEGLRSIGDNAFSGCKSLQALTLPSSLTTLGDDLFDYCSALSYTVFEGGKYLGNAENPHLLLVGPVDASVQSFSTASDTKFIASSAFLECGTLLSFTASDSVIGIGSSAFWDCYALQSVSPGQGLITIGDNAFSYCSALTEITLPSTLQTVGASAFEYCESLAAVALPDGVTHIGSSAFYGCSSLVQVTLPNALVSLGGSVFTNCVSLACTALDGGYYLGSPENPYLLLVKLTDKHLTAFTLAPTTRFIHSAALRDCTVLERVTLGESLESIGLWAFSGCESLIAVEIPATVKTIENWAFLGCERLKTVSFAAPEGWRAASTASRSDSKEISLSDPAENRALLVGALSDYIFFKAT